MTPFSAALPLPVHAAYGGLGGTRELLVLGLVAAGVAIGIAGAIFGARAEYRRAVGPHQRKAAVRLCVAWLVFALAFVVLLELMPKPYGELLWVPYALLLTWGIRRTNRASAMARARDLAALGEAVSGEQGTVTEGAEPDPGARGPRDDSPPSS